jgi:hypothetical protein
VLAWPPAAQPGQLPAAERQSLGRSIDQARLRARLGVETVVSQPFRIVDPEMRDTPSDGETVGEVLLQGNNVMLGYFQDDEATDRAFTGEWFHTGDLAVRHRDGYMEVKNRAKDVIISGGENISAIEVEQALLEHPDILEVGVVGVPDEKWGEVLVAHILVRDRATPPDPDDVIELLRDSLAGYKIPRRYVFPENLSRLRLGEAIRAGSHDAGGSRRSGAARLAARPGLHRSGGLDHRREQGARPGDGVRLRRRGRRPGAERALSRGARGDRADAPRARLPGRRGGLEMLTPGARRRVGLARHPRQLARPGYIETEMTEGLRAHDGLSADILGRTPLERFAKPAEIAACAMFLASPVASYVTGTTLLADGGWSAR